MIEEQCLKLDDSVRVTFDTGYDRYSYKISMADFIGCEIGFNVRNPLITPEAKKLEDFCLSEGWEPGNDEYYYSPDNVCKMIYNGIVLGKLPESKCVNWTPFPSVANMEKKDIFNLIKNTYFV